MNVFHKYTLQNLKKNKTRTIVTIIGIILSVAMFSATILSLSSAMHYMTSYVEQTVAHDRESRLLVCIMRDVTDEENEREKKESISRQTIEVADKVVDKQMRIVQEIASLLGETAAETKIALSKLKESIQE